MNANLESPGPSDPKPISSITVLGARLMWTFLGPIALVLITYGIITQGSGWMTALDAIFGAVVGMMLLGRWVEHRSGSAITLTGEPATIDQCRRYSAKLLLLALAAWAAANAVGNHFLS